MVNWGGCLPKKPQGSGSLALRMAAKPWGASWEASVSPPDNYCHSISFAPEIGDADSRPHLPPPPLTCARKGINGGRGIVLDEVELWLWFWYEDLGFWFLRYIGNEMSMLSGKEHNCIVDFTAREAFFYMHFQYMYLVLKCASSLWIRKIINSYENVS